MSSNARRPPETLESGVREARAAAEEREARPPCIVGIGASASSGVESIVALLRRLPPRPGLAVVVATDATSALTKRLARGCSIAVVEASNGAIVAADHVYVAPPGARVTCERHRLRVRDFSDGPQAPIDALLRSMAIAYRDRSAGAILSGAGSDGAIGIEAIKAAGGVTFAEEIRSAKDDEMPQSAVSTGDVDFMLPPAEIGARLVAIAERARAICDPTQALDDDGLAAILAHVRTARGIDLGNYRKASIRRRVTRRLLAARASGAAEYVELLRTRPSEVDALIRDALVRLTQFFRDPDVFEAIRRTALPELVRWREREAPLRVWAAGCATGEEAYSIAISIAETAEELGIDAPFEIVATDIDDVSLSRARDGAYSENIAMDVSPERLSRFFTRVGKRWVVSREIRAACTFTRQDVTRDPPPSQLDLVSCRNLLRYLRREPVRRALASFHAALRADGALLLGASEGVDAHEERFEAAAGVRGLYTARGGATPRRRILAEPRRMSRDGERAVAAARESLELAVQQYEATHEELLATNDELLASNDALLASNDALRRTKAELLTANDDLTAVNDELARRNETLSSLNDDLSNLIASVALPIVIVNRNQEIRRFTPEAARLFRLVPTDVGRPLGDFRLRIDAPDLPRMVGEVIDAGGERERDVRDDEGQQYTMRVRSYVTAEHRVEGAVIILMNIDLTKREET